jgi:hypothetical protein
LGAGTRAVGQRRSAVADLSTEAKLIITLLDLLASEVDCASVV